MNAITFVNIKPSSLNKELLMTSFLIPRRASSSWEYASVSTIVLIIPPSYYF